MRKRVESKNKKETGFGWYCALFFLYEKYKDKYIAYSLGKFCFGGNSNPEDKDTMIFQQTSTFKKGVVQKNDDIQMIPCSLSSATGYNDYCPTPLEGDSKQRVLDKIEEYSKDL